MAQKCCNKLAAQLGEAKRELTRLARLEAYHSQQGHNVSRFPALIGAARDQVARIKVAIEDHEADHAADEVSLGRTSDSDQEQLAAHSIQTGARA